MNKINEVKTTSNNEEMDIIEVTEEQLEELLRELGQDNDLEPAQMIDKVLFEERHIYLQGVIDADTVNQVVPMIHYYNSEDKANNISSSQRTPIKIFINSVGGEITQGKVILSAMENSDTPIETISQGGSASSMGMVLFLCGHVKKMSRHTEMMYHNLSAGLSGTYAEMKNQIAYYERIQNEMDAYIVERTEIPMKKLKRYRERNLDWHMSFEECKKYKVFDVEI